MEVENTEVIKAAVAAGLGISIISASADSTGGKNRSLETCEDFRSFDRATIQAHHGQESKPFKSTESLSGAHHGAWVLR